MVCSLPHAKYRRFRAEPEWLVTAHEQNACRKTRVHERSSLHGKPQRGRPQPKGPCERKKFDHRNNKQKQFYPDFLLARADTPKKVTADDLLFVLEVVSTDDRRKERKDTVVMRALNEYNEVDEFVLYFPDIEDDSIESPGY